MHAKAAAVVHAVLWDRLSSSAELERSYKTGRGQKQVETCATEGDSPVGEVDWSS